MKTLYALISLLLGMGKVCAQDTETPKPPPKEPTPWSIRVELQVISLPQSVALPLITDFGDSSKAEKSHAALQRMLMQKKATLEGWLILFTKSGDRVNTEQTDELRFPTELEPPAKSNPDKPGESPASLLVDAHTDPTPTAFEVRNLGLNLEVEPTLAKDGKTMDINIESQHVQLTGFDPAPGGKAGALAQPRIHTNKVSTSMKLRVGQHVLLDAKPMAKPDGHMELFILSATAEKIE